MIYPHPLVLRLPAGFFVAQVFRALKPTSLAPCPYYALHPNLIYFLPNPFCPNTMSHHPWAMPLPVCALSDNRTCHGFGSPFPLGDLSLVI